MTACQHLYAPRRTLGRTHAECNVATVNIPTPAPGCWGMGGGADVVERELCLIIEWVTNFTDVEGRLSLTYNE